jgi:hypothetical protein
VAGGGRGVGGRVWWPAGGRRPGGLAVAVRVAEVGPALPVVEYLRRRQSPGMPERAD